MKTLEIVSLIFAMLFVVLMIASVLFYSVTMIVVSVVCMAISLVAADKA